MKWCDTSIIPALSRHIITHAQLGRQLLFFLTSYTFLLGFNTNLGSVSTQSCCGCPHTANEGFFFHSCAEEKPLVSYLGDEDECKQVRNM